MIPLKQTIFGEDNGNCLSACLASLLEIPVEDVPCFVKEDRSGWYENLQAWLVKRGLMLLRVRMPKEIMSGEDIRWHPLPAGCLCIASGKSPRGEFGHAVVGTIEDGLNFVMLHDPHPDNTGIDGPPYSVEFLVPLNPVGIERKKKKK